MNALDSSSTRPYLIRALYEWCTDNGFTPYVAVLVDDTVQVPREYVKNGEIVLNISYDATSALKLGNDYIEFKARFAGVARDIFVPIGRVMAIYARENGQGMAFPVGDAPAAAGSPAPSGPAAAKPSALTSVPSSVPDGQADEAQRPAPAESGDSGDEPPRPPAAPGARPSLKRIK